MTAEQLLVEVGEERYALSVASVVEVLRTASVTPLPGAPPAVLGLYNVRGQPLPVLDLAALLGLAAPAHRPYAVMVEEGGRRAGLAVDAVLDVAGLDGSVAPAEFEGPITGSIMSGDSLVGLLDVRAVLDRVNG